MAVSASHRGWLLKHNEGILAGVYNGAQPGTTLLAANTALDGVLIGTPVSPALAVDSLVISNMVASGDILIAVNNGGNSQAYLMVDASAGVLHLFSGGVEHVASSSGNMVINETSEDINFRVETDSIQYAIYSDGGKNSLVLGSNTDTSSADQLITVSRAARTATANTNYYDLAMAPAGAVTVPAGTTTVVATVSIAEPNITATGTVTTAATLYIASQPTEGSSNGAVVLADDLWVALGTNADQVLINRSTILATNTALTGVMIGTPVTPAIAANSLIISNTTASGDVIVAANLGGNSQAWLWIDSSAGTFNLYGAGTATAIITSTAVTVLDDILLAVGTGSTARISYDTTDANANELLIQLPAGGATDVPVIVIGQSIESVDLALYNGVVDPHIAMFGVGAVTTGPVIEFRKARGTVAAPTVVTAGDDLGTLRAFACVANGEYVQSAEIRFDAVATPATTRGPGTITFLTATDAAPSVLTQAMLISAAQVVTMASTLIVQGASATVGVAGTTTGTLVLAGATSGTCTLTPTAAAGSYTITLPPGANTNAGYQLTCAGADTITTWAAAGSLREYKDIAGLASPQDALDKLLGTNVYRFHYKDGKGTQDSETEYVGVMADEAPWAMHYKGGVLNPVNALGFTVLGFQAMAAKIKELESKLAALAA